MAAEKVDLQADILAIETPEHFRLFFRRYFKDPTDYSYFRLYHECLEKGVMGRLLNVDYLRFSARVFAMAAEYGFPSTAGYTSRHSSGRFERSFTDSLHLLALGCYLANVTLQAWEQKNALIEEFNRRDGQDEKRDQGILFSAAGPVGGQVKFYSYEDFCKLQQEGRGLGPRQRTGMPLILPDIPFHRAVAEIGLTSWEADTITPEHFKEKYYPKAVVPLSPYANLERVFFTG